MRKVKVYSLHSLNSSSKGKILQRESMEEGNSMTTLADLTGIDADAKVTIFKVQTDGHNHFGSGYSLDYCATANNAFYKKQHTWVAGYLKKMIPDFDEQSNWVAVNVSENDEIDNLIVGSSENLKESVRKRIDNSLEETPVSINGSLVDIEAELNEDFNSIKNEKIISLIL